MKRYVVMGSTTGHDYSFFLPIVCEAWKKCGYEPVVFLIGDEAEWSTARTRDIRKILEWRGVTKKHVHFVTGIEPATLAQSIRLHAAADPFFKPYDLLIPSDADLIPIHRGFYEQHDLEQYAIASYYSNGYIGENEHFPSCHISAQVGTWRGFMEYASKDPREAMIATLKKHGIEQKMKDKEADQRKNWGWVWFMDEHSVSSQIVKSRFYPDSFQRIEREGHPPKDRLDRACWPAKYDPSKYSDCHSIRPGWSDANWPRLRPLIKYLMPEHMDWIDDYRAKFREAMGCPG